MFLKILFGNFFFVSLTVNVKMSNILSFVT